MSYLGQYHIPSLNFGGKKIMKQIAFELVYPVMQSYVAMKGELAADLSFSSSSYANMGGHTFFMLWDNG